MNLIVNFMAILAGLFLDAMLLPADAGANETADRTVHLLEYVAVDYPEAVVAGRVVSDLEYQEQLSFLGLVGVHLRELGVTDEDPLLVDAMKLRLAVESKAGEEVTTAATALATAVRQRFRAGNLPPRVPDLAQGKSLYVEACASCHGVGGKGDGPKAAEHNPRPANLTDRERMFALPLSAVYATITYGIESTAMASFAEAYDEAQRFDLAFYVGSLAFSDDEVASGRVQFMKAPADAAQVVHGIGELVRRPVADLATDERERTIVAYLRHHPESLTGIDVSFGLVRARLLEALKAYDAGDRSRAVDLLISAYLDGFEPIEPALSAVDHRLRVRIEGDFLRYREQMQAGLPSTEVIPTYAALRRSLDEADERLESGEFNVLTAFMSSLTIMAREGLEAILLVVALSGILIRAGHREALRYVHVGWIGALLAGGATWLAARYLLVIGGFERELIEGVTSLLAMAILFYVSYWLVAKVSSRRWQIFLQRRIRTALTRGALWTLTSIAFVAVYREIFETILFYEAIVARAGESGIRAIVGGALVGLCLLSGLAIATFRFGLRLPMRRFFVVSSALLYFLAIMLAGHGVAALQEAGVLSLTTLRFVRIEWLGIYPTVQGVALQLLLVLAAIVAGATSIIAARTGIEDEKVTVQISQI